MKIFTSKYLIKHGALPEEEQTLEVPVFTLKTADTIREERILITGSIIPFLTQAVGNKARSAVCHPDSSVSITVSCDGQSCKLYESRGTIPCNGREHHLWLLGIRKDICVPLEKFMTNVALSSVGGKI